MRRFSCQTIVDRESHLTTVWEPPPPPPPPKKGVRNMISELKFYLFCTDSVEQGHQHHLKLVVNAKPQVLPTVSQ